ncbi:hypothetical protein HF1_12300 [Mycoplasma haemofelis str. Langford 1]|uniref:Uncharacterized protein n=1 Tax=Mycoplasma haemofelis (strain Langford 1) TaxID=941640 RepID=E8ZJB7_MYCHL|nr:hypothetical protein [Mycoplasma haemofelis]CBY93238.1 hypothetical protein HF1_12300 [Mycoplasma haemofelis str. Langford 1]
MSNSLAFKSLLGLGGVSAVTGAAIGIPKLLSDDKREEHLISDLIKVKNPEKRLISSKEVGDSAWKKAWEVYRNENKLASKGKDAFQLLDWNDPILGDISVSDEANKGLIDICFENSGKRSSLDSQLYRDVLKYCTRDTKISDLIRDAGKTVLIKGGDSNQWKKAWERYRLAHQGSGTDPWTIDKFSENKSKADQPASEDFQNKCVERLERASISDVKLIDEVTKWCTVEGK